MASVSFRIGAVHISQYCILKQVLRQLGGGAAIAIVSDAGLPTISDPGSSLIRAAIDARHNIIPIPGPSAFLTALVASGLDTSEFLFIGFLPPKPAARQRKLQQLAGVP